MKTTIEPEVRSDGALTILLVDDDADCRMLTRDAIALSNADNQVFEVSDGQEAMDFLLHRGKWVGAPRPGLIYMDIEMPCMDGQSALKAIKADPNLRDIPVVMMTGLNDEAQMRKAAEAGANSYTLKPATAEQFFKTVAASTNYWLNVHQYPDQNAGATDCRK